MRLRPVGEVLAALRLLGVTIRDDGPRLAAVHDPGHGCGARRSGGHRRVGVLAVRLGAAAGRREVRQGRRRAARRQARAVHAAHRDDGLPAAPPRRRGRRRGAEPLAGLPRPDRRPRHRDRAGPLQRRALPGARRDDAAGRSRSATGRARPPRPGTGSATCWPGWAARSTLERRRAHRQRTGRARRASTPTSTTSASSPRSSPRSARWPTSPSVLRGIAHIRGHETDRLAALARELGGLGADVAETEDGLAFRPGPAARRAVPHLRRPPDGARRRRRRLRRRRRAGRGRRHHRARPSRTSPTRGAGSCDRVMSPGQRRYGEEDQEHYDRPRRRTRPRTKERPTYDDAHDGVVLTVDRGRYGVVVGDTAVTTMKARPLGRKGVVVGDRVRVVGDVSGEEGSLARIVEVAERTTTLRRSADDDDAVERVIVANADQLVIVSALADPEPRTGLIDRALVAAYDSRHEAAALPDEVRPRRPRDPAGHLPPAGRAVGGDPQGRRPRRAHRAAVGAHERADRPQRRREVHARQRARARRGPRDRARQRGHRPGPAHLDVGDHAAAPRRGRGRGLDHRHPRHPVLRARARAAGAPHRGVPGPRRDDRGLPARLHARRGRARVRARRGRRARRRRPGPGRVVPPAAGGPVSQPLY